MRVIYIGGWQRSGTTLLSEMLGSLDGAVALGEVSGIWGAARHNHLCSCGVRVRSCSIWGPALRAVQSEHGVCETDYGEMESLSISVLRTRRARELDRLQGLRRAEWPADVRTYVDMLTTLLESVRRVSKAKAFVDSSKLPPGMLIYKLMSSEPINVLHILRDPRGVVNSEAKTLGKRDYSTSLTPQPPGHTMIKSIAYWSIFNLAVQYWGKRAGQYALLRYETLAADPNEVLADLAKSLSLGPPNLKLLKRSHIVTGNPARFGIAMREIAVDDSWRRELGVSRRAAVMCLSLPARLAGGWI